MSGSTAARATTALWALLFALPWLLPVSSVPDSVFYNQLLAVAVWGAWLALGPGRSEHDGKGSVGGALWAAGLALALCIAASVLAGTALQGGGALVMAAALAVLIGSAGASRAAAALPVAYGLWLAGVLSCVVALLQYFVPALADGWLIASSSTPGRAVGNMRQPNHLATALLCAMVMTAWLWQAGRLRSWVATASIGAMVLALAMTASRTGALSLAVLVAWAVADRRLPRRARILLAITPVLYLVCWGAIAAYASLDHTSFYGSERLQSGTDISSSRFAIWKNALTLLAANPWTGVGWGHFNAAWTLTPFPDRPVAFFDHTHNLPLQLAVEIGVPATLAVLGLLLWAVWRARAALHEEGINASPARAALVMLSVLAVHSLLEYPLWYAYFLLPAAWALGLFIGSAPGARAPSHRLARHAVRLAGGLMLAASLWAGWEHRLVEQIFAPSTRAAPLAQRIESGRRSLLFGHHADYAAVTTAPADTALQSFRRPLLQLIDLRLLQAYAEALHAAGHEPEAVYAAQRLREFKRPDAQAWFAECDEPEPAWQCDTRPVQGLDWRGLAQAGKK